MEKSNERANTDNKRLFRRFTNVSLLVLGGIMVLSGLYIQIHYHMQQGGISGFDQWTIIHKWSALLFTGMVAAHAVLHLKWYKAVLEKRLLKRNRVTLMLSLSMLVVSLLGFAPWILSAVSSHLELRHMLIEIHDKLGVAFIVIMMGHIIKRHNWYTKMR